MIINKIKKALGMENPELIKAGINPSQLTRWKQNGFPQSNEIILNLLIDKIESLESVNLTNFSAEDRSKIDQAINILRNIKPLETD